MATITFKGILTHTCGELPAIGSQAPDFCLTRSDLEDVSLSDFAAVVILDAKDKVLYTEQVPEISKEPDYDKGLAAFR